MISFEKRFKELRTIYVCVFKYLYCFDAYIEAHSMWKYINYNAAETEIDHIFQNHTAKSSKI